MFEYPHGNDEVSKVRVAIWKGLTNATRQEVMRHYSRRAVLTAFINSEWPW